jgi:zinc transporter ZupT
VPIFFIYALNIVFLASTKAKKHIIYYLISFAIGGLLGDVFFHTIPHLSSGGHSHSHDHDHHDHSHGSHSHNTEDMLNNTIIILGILAFFLIEKITHSYFGHSHDHSSHSHEKDKKKDDD